MHGLGRAKFADVGAAREGFACAGQHNGHHSGVSQRLLHALGDALAGGQAQAIDRRVVEGDNGNIAVNLVVGSHAFNP